MDNCRWWVGACGVGLLYPFFDGGGCLLCSQRGVGHRWVLVVVEKKDICRGLFVNVALLDPSRKLWVTPPPALQVRVWSRLQHCDLYPYP